MKAKPALPRETRERIRMTAERIARSLLKHYDIKPKKKGK